MATDALSDVLRTVRLAGAVYFDVAARAPWVAEQPTREMVLPKILPGAGHLISYHVVTEGSCFAGLIGAEPIAVEAGEVIVFTKGDRHVMSSSPGMRANLVTPDAFDEAAASPLPFSVNYGGGGQETRLVCGFLESAELFTPVFRSLPEMLVEHGVQTVAVGGDLTGQLVAIQIVQHSEPGPGLRHGLQASLVDWVFTMTDHR